MKSLKSFGLLPFIVLAIILGVVLGGVMPIWGLRIFATFSSLFGNFLKFIIPLLIVGLIVPAIGNIGRTAGRLLLLTILLAYLDGAFAGFFAYLGSVNIFPGLIPAKNAVGEAGNIVPLEPFFTVEMPPVFDVVSALLLAFTLGLGIAYFQGKYMKGVFEEFRQIVEWVISKAIIPLLPLYIFSIFLSMSHTGEAMHVLRVFMGVIGVIFVMHLFWLILEYSISGLVVKRNPLRMLLTMLPAYFTALGTSSSAATIPVTLQRTQKLGVNDSVASFVVPLCATIHMPGSILKITSCAVAVMLMQNQAFDAGMFAAFILSLGIMAIAAPGVPGGTVMTALALLQSVLGFADTDQALMIALYIAMDSFGTAGNVTGDGAIAVIVDRFRQKAP